MVRDDNRLNEGADGWCELACLLALYDRSAEHLHLAAIAIDDVWMQHDRRQSLVLAQLSLGDGERFLSGGYRILDLIDCGTGSEGVYQPMDLGFQLIDTRLGRAEAGRHVLALFGAAFVISLDHAADDFGGKELLLKAAQDAAFELGRPDPADISTGARLAVTDAAPAVFGDDSIGRTALAASDQAGEDVAFALLTIEGSGRVRFTPCLHFGPAGRIHNAQLLNRLLNAVGRFGQAGDTLARAGVLSHLDAAIDDATVISGVA